MGVGWERVWLASPSGWHRTDDQELPGEPEDSVTVVNAHVGPGSVLRTPCMLSHILFTATLCAKYSVIPVLQRKTLELREVK